MRCPFCEHHETKVLDSRPQNRGFSVRRRRECSRCKRRFTTYEEFELQLPQVIKKDRRREPFDKKKLIRGLQLACRKRPISLEAIESIALEIQREIAQLNLKEIESKEIGEKVIRHLKKLDVIAYIRFASVYREFEDLEQFIKEVQELTSREKGKI